MEYNPEKIMEKIYSEYWEPIYYIWSTGQLSKDIPQELYSVLGCPPITNQSFEGFKIGDFIQFKDSTTAGQILYIWPSINRVELSMGANKFGRGSNAGGSINSLIESTVLVYAQTILSFYRECYPEKFKTS